MELDSWVCQTAGAILVSGRFFTRPALCSQNRAIVETTSDAFSRIAAMSWFYCNVRKFDCKVWKPCSLLVWNLSPAIVGSGSCGALAFWFLLTAVVWWDGMFLLKQFPLFHVFYTNIYMVYILNCVKLYFVYITVQYGGTSFFFFFPFGTVLYSIRSIRVGNVKSILGLQNVSIVISNSFGEINVLGMVEILTYGRQ